MAIAGQSRPLKVGSTYFWVIAPASASRTLTCALVVATGTFEAGGGLPDGAGVGAGGWITASGMAATGLPGAYAQAGSPPVAGEPVAARRDGDADVALDAEGVAGDAVSSGVVADGLGVVEPQPATRAATMARARQADRG